MFFVNNAVNNSKAVLLTRHAITDFQIMPRNQNALAIVNAAFLVKLKKDTITDVSIVYGNISAEFNHAKKTESFLEGTNIFNNSTLQTAIGILHDEIEPEDEPPKASPECRKKIAIGLFYKVHITINSLQE